VLVTRRNGSSHAPYALTSSNCRPSSLWIDSTDWTRNGLRYLRCSDLLQPHLLLVWLIVPRVLIGLMLFLTRHPPRQLRGRNKGRKSYLYLAIASVGDDYP
jgi:hypothetical protein